MGSFEELSTNDAIGLGRTPCDSFLNGKPGITSISRSNHMGNIASHICSVTVIS
jgi:hypothetical protein